MFTISELKEKAASSDGSDQGQLLLSAAAILVPAAEAVFHERFRLLVEAGGYETAALSLVERVLPDHRWGVGAVGITSGVHPDGKPAYVEGFRAHVTERSPLRPMPVTGGARTAPLAILIAALTALQARSKE